MTRRCGCGRPMVLLICVTFSLAIAAGLLVLSGRVLSGRVLDAGLGSGGLGRHGGLGDAQQRPDALVAEGAILRVDRLGKSVAEQQQAIPGLDAVALLESEGWYEESPNSKVASDQLAAAQNTPASLGALLGNFVGIRDIITIAIEDIQGIVRSLTKDGIGILITDHNVRATLEIVDRAYILHEGHVLMSGTTEEVVRDENVRRVYLGQNFRIG